MPQDEQGKRLGRIITKAWEDDGFKQRLLRDATSVLKEEGVPVPKGVEIKVLEDTKTLYNVVLPEKPLAIELDDAHLAEVAGGKDVKESKWWRDLYRKIHGKDYGEQ